MGALRDKLRNLCDYPPKTQPEYQYQNHLDLITQLTKQLFTDHVNDIVDNFTDFHIRNEPANNDYALIEISRFQMPETPFHFYDDKVQLGYQMLVVSPTVIVSAVKNAGFVINIFTTFKGKDNNPPRVSPKFIDIDQRDFYQSDRGENTLFDRINEVIGKYDTWFPTHRNSGFIKVINTDTEVYSFNLDIR